MLPHAAVQAVGAAKQLLQLCALAGRAVNGNELYKAFKLLERAQAEFLGPPSDPTQCVPQTIAAGEAPATCTSPSAMCTAAGSLDASSVRA